MQPNWSEPFPVIVQWLNPHNWLIDHGCTVKIYEHRIIERPEEGSRLSVAIWTEQFECSYFTLDLPWDTEPGYGPTWIRVELVRRFLRRAVAEIRAVLKKAK